MGTIKDGVEYYPVPASVLDVADRRTRRILFDWSINGSGNLKQLLFSAYLQGIEDGFAAGQLQQEKSHEVKGDYEQH